MKGDKIYIFGFSRGAYTARFLAEMICNIGLLSRGNEEMVDFVWYQYSDYQRNRQEKGSSKKLHQLIKKMHNTFCRAEAKVHFLGLFDCVNSVNEFSIPLFGKGNPYVPTTPAKHVRHAVSLNERRAKFKPALFLLEKDLDCDTLDEVWFCGNHGDVGGGWPWSATDPRMLLSDITLQWMINEVHKVDMDDPVSDAIWYSE
jgi:uncharacterized protein (DUF2235 family)